MKFKAGTIAEFLKGQVEGDPEVEVTNISKIEEGKPGTLAFLANPKYEKYIYETEASIVLVNKDFKATGKINATLVRVENA
jgi:UDP-3-O-[3-hydroxymyristoyl] glucosamine N-acyltransferase